MCHVRRVVEAEQRTRRSLRQDAGQWTENGVVVPVVLPSVGRGVATRNFFLFFFFCTVVTGPRRSLSLKLSDTRVYEKLGATAPARPESLAVRARSPGPHGGVRGVRWFKFLTVTTKYLHHIRS